ncbi:MAG: aminotransferase class I/II-fold pyridoxal phosphate-dependent enzyme [Proteobacteria bacterium]|nr:MAG: aminotransferase class I/II-fold pyridoxal phosphate-dependent enzyme [Pseudomonadota bacterium]
MEAITNCDPDVAKTVESLKDRAAALVQALEEIKGIKVSKPEGAFYLWVDISTFLGKSLDGQVIKTSNDFTEAYLNDQMVAAVPGSEFGLDGYLRLSYALSKADAKRAVDRLKVFVAKLK